MIDLKKHRLPEAVEVGGSLYPVHTSFKYWLRFLELIADKNTPPGKFDFMYSTDKKPESRLRGLIALVQFCNPPRELPRTKSDSENVLDYSIDADFIFSAFLEQYGIDLLDSDMHWHKFQALLFGLHGTKLNEIIGYRSYENTSGKRDAYTRQMEKLRAAWDLPQDSGDDEDLRAFEAKLYGSNSSPEKGY